MDRHLGEQPQSLRVAVEKPPLPDGRGSVKSGHVTSESVTPDNVARNRARVTEPRPLGSGGPVDDDTAAYILESRKHFEDLRQVAAQLAGLLVLAATGSKNAGPHHPLVEAADRLYHNAVESLRHARVTERARRHHHYLLQAAAALRTALSAARSGLAIDPVLIPLRAAYAQLQRASNELPGFQMVAFEQGCCGSKS